MRVLRKYYICMGSVLASRQSLLMLKRWYYYDRTLLIKQSSHICIVDIDSLLLHTFLEYFRSKRFRSRAFKVVHLFAALQSDTPRAFEQNPTFENTEACGNTLYNQMAPNTDTMLSSSVQSRHNKGFQILIIKLVLCFRFISFLLAITCTFRWSWNWPNIE